MTQIRYWVRETKEYTVLYKLRDSSNLLLLLGWPGYLIQADNAAYILRSNQFRVIAHWIVVQLTISLNDAMKTRVLCYVLYRTIE